MTVISTIYIEWQMRRECLVTAVSTSYADRYVTRVTVARVLAQVTLLRMVWLFVKVDGSVRTFVLVEMNRMMIA